MIGSLSSDNSVAFRLTKNGHKPSKSPLNSLKIGRTDPIPLVYPGEKVGNPPRGNQSVHAVSNRCVRRGILGALVQLPVPATRLAYVRDEYEVRTMEWMGSRDGTSEYPSVCDATDGYVRCDDAGEVVRSKLFLGHFERHRTPSF